MKIIVLGVHTHGHLFIVITNLFNSTPVMSNSCLNSANLISYRRSMRFLLQQNENEFPILCQNLFSCRFSSLPLN